MNLHLNLADQLRERDAREAERLEWERLDAERRADLHADWGLTERHEGVLYVAPQGRVEQGWPARRGGMPEMSCWAPDDEPRESLSPAEAILLAAIYCISAVFVAWLLVTVSKAWSNS